MNTGDICAEWSRRRLMHPFFGEKKSEADISAMWDSSAATYSDSNYSDIKRRILEHLEDGGILKGRTVVDIGCGPGTYAVPMSRMSKSVLAVDRSEAMLSRLRSRCEEEHLGNVETLVSDCLSMPPEAKRDIAFSSLCPPMNTPESILMMERFAGERCVYVSSATTGSSAEIEIWKSLGKDYSYDGYNTNFPSSFLRSVGRSTELFFFSEEREERHPEQEAVERYTRFMGRYRPLDEDIENAVRDVVADHTEDGEFIQKRTNTMGLLIWTPCA